MYRKKQNQRNKNRLHWVPVGILSLCMTTVSVGCGTPTNHNQSNGANSSANVASQATNNTATSGSSASAFPLTVIDDSKTKVTVPKEPMHIVSDTEGTDEILVSLVPKSRIALVTNLSSNPAYSNVINQVKGIPQVADDNPETILAGHPDLALMASYVKPGVVSQVRNAGVPVYEFDDFTSVASIEKNIQIIGKLVGAQTKASQLVDNMQTNIKSIEQAVSGKSKPTVLDYSSYGFAGGSNTTVNEMIRDAGGVNAAANLNGWQKITDEEIVKMNPNVIIDSVQDKAFLKKLAADPALQSINAVKNHQLYAIPDADLSSVSQYIVTGIADIAKVIHPNTTLPSIQVMQ